MTLLAISFISVSKIFFLSLIGLKKKIYVLILFSDNKSMNMVQEYTFIR